MVSSIKRLMAGRTYRAEVAILSDSRRNPSLTLASTQRMYVRKIKDDPKDASIALSILSVNG